MIIFLKFKNFLERTRRFLKSEKFLDFLTLCIILTGLSVIVFLHILLGKYFPSILYILILTYAISFLVYQTINLIKKGRFKELWKIIKKSLLTNKNTVVEWIYGKEYFVRINKTWSVQRVKRFKRKDCCKRVVVKYGPDKHKWVLEPDDYDKVLTGMSQDVIDDLIIKTNIAELKRHNHSKNDSMDDLSPLQCYYNNE